MAENGNVAVPLDADKKLFADDMMKFIMSTAWTEKTYSPTGIVKFRHLVYNGFTDAVKRTLEIIDEEICVHLTIYFHERERKRRLNAICLTDYGRKHGPPDLSKGFRPLKFLMYCAHVAYFASYLFTAGFEEAIEIAIDMIVQAFPEGEMLQETWDCLEKAAQRYVNIEKKFEALLSPSCIVKSQSPSKSDESFNSSRSEGKFPKQLFTDAQWTFPNCLLSPIM